jgi:hypothetical protein
LLFYVCYGSIYRIQMNLLKRLFKGKDEPVKSYPDFWQWFVGQERTFFNVVRRRKNIERDFFNKLSPKLGELKEGFYYLTGMLDDNTVELIFTADGNIENLVFVEELVASAPEIAGWKFTAHKSEMDIESTSIRVDKYLFDSDTLSFYSNDNPQYPDEIDITIVHKDFNESDNSSIMNGVYLFLDNYLGEVKSVTTIDSVKVVGTSDAERELVPIGKLKSFLDWREKEFVEKYHGLVKDTHDMGHSVLEAETSAGTRVIAVINTDILKWESKASHPWILRVEISYDGSKNGGLPDEETNDALRQLEDAIAVQLKDEEGYILIGHESAENLRSIYFACRDFRKPSKVVYQLLLDEPDWKIEYRIYKDKYWQSFNRYNLELLGPGHNT